MKSVFQKQRITSKKGCILMVLIAVIILGTIIILQATAPIDEVKVVKTKEVVITVDNDGTITPIYIPKGITLKVVVHDDRNGTRISTLYDHDEETMGLERSKNR